MANTIGEFLLSPYRVLDLADEKGLLCGKILGDLGADVIKVERPGGDVAGAWVLFIMTSPIRRKASSGFPLIPARGE